MGGWVGGWVGGHVDGVGVVRWRALGGSVQASARHAQLGCRQHSVPRLAVRKAVSRGTPTPMHCTYPGSLGTLGAHPADSSRPAPPAPLPAPATGNVGSGMDHLLLVLDHVRATRPHWNATGGRDHFFVSPALVSPQESNRWQRRLPGSQ